MSDYVTAVALIALYRIMTLVIGLLCIRMGYALLKGGVFAPSDMSLVWGDRRLLIRRAAPGTLFALFGAGLIAISLWKGLDVSSARSGSPSDGAVTRLAGLAMQVVSAETATTDSVTITARGYEDDPEARLARSGQLVILDIAPVLPTDDIVLLKRVLGTTSTAISPNDRKRLIRQLSAIDEWTVDHAQGGDE